MNNSHSLKIWPTALVEMSDLSRLCEGNYEPVNLVDDYVVPWEPVHERRCHIGNDADKEEARWSNCTIALQHQIPKRSIDNGRISLLTFISVYAIS
jgi:hypothetical protein